jgi:hypothetical protein
MDFLGHLEAVDMESARAGGLIVHCGHMLPGVKGQDIRGLERVEGGIHLVSGVGDAEVQCPVWTGAQNRGFLSVFFPCGFAGRTASGGKFALNPDGGQVMIRPSLISFQ